MGEGGAKRRMRGISPRAHVWRDTPHPSRRCAAIHPLPQGERESEQASRTKSPASRHPTRCGTRVPPCPWLPRGNAWRRWRRR
ncbi:hypothetical protein C7U92_22400 [Bradyrhizobium sp. WBOS7]|nr:hypothetical protein [Bradyrhizobium sp. WBOS2]MDD1573618.1 hypothetical protein [Bradyrhizobium sp. WBOS1]MDD1579449.1 hypothetical protein [Bradyrhizobium sp. WBOS7]MDD1602114.1 hypothetical protein [Bradyrhizobium sp. WBOS16]